MSSHDEAKVLIALMRDPPCQLCRGRARVHGGQDHEFWPPTLQELADWFAEMSGIFTYPKEH